LHGWEESLCALASAPDAGLSTPTDGTLLDWIGLDEYKPHNPKQQTHTFPTMLLVVPEVVARFAADRKTIQIRWSAECGMADHI
jgi:hypothetical protein